ncbi:MAG: hypothetical protein KF729_22950 [Sandaracinaceae bacterium]|nr:hypothetical protein [Sandaracinaceae bacterium]
MGPEWIVIGMVVATLLGGVGAAALGAARRASPYQDAMERRWTEAAAHLGGRLEVGTRRALEPRELRLHVERDDASVLARLKVPVSPDAEAYTYAEARFVLGVGPRFVAQPRTVGEPPEDGMPVPLRTGAGDARAAFTREARALAEAIGRPLTIRSDGARVEALWHGAETELAILDAVVALVAALARHGADHLRGLSTLDDATYEPASDEGPRVRVRQGVVDVRFLVRPGADGAIYLARVDARPGTPEVEVAVAEGGAPARPIPDGLVAPGLERELARVAPATLVASERHVELVFAEPPSLDQAKAAVQLLRPIGASAGSQGAFR